MWDRHAACPNLLRCNMKSLTRILTHTQAVVINPAFAFPLVSSYDKRGAELVLSGKRQGALAGNSRSAFLCFNSAPVLLKLTDAQFVLSDERQGALAANSRSTLFSNPAKLLHMLGCPVDLIRHCSDEFVYT